MADDDAGHKQPPKNHQFKPGQSGNPTGRKKQVTDFKKDLMAELRKNIVVRENGRERRMTKQQAFITTLLALAIKGDIRAINAIVACTRNFGAAADKSEEDHVVNANDLDIFQEYIDRQRQRQALSQSST